MAERRPDQKVDAFSAPRSLLRLAQMKAKARRMSKSGFYRFCLAKEVGFSEEEALQIAEPGVLDKFKIEEPEKKPVVYPTKKQVTKGLKTKGNVKIVQK